MPLHIGGRASVPPTRRRCCRLPKYVREGCAESDTPATKLPQPSDGLRRDCHGNRGRSDRAAVPGRASCRISLPQISLTIGLFTNSYCHCNAEPTRRRCSNIPIRQGSQAVPTSDFYQEAIHRFDQMRLHHRPRLAAAFGVTLSEQQQLRTSCIRNPFQFLNSSKVDACCARRGACIVSPTRHSTCFPARSESVASGTERKL